VSSKNEKIKCYKYIGKIMIKIHSQHRIKAPKALPLELAEVKHFLKIEHAEDDKLLHNLIEAVTTRFESYTNYALISQDWQVSFQRLNGLLIPIPMRPVCQINAAETLDYNGRATSMDLRNIYLDHGASCARLAIPPMGHMLKVRYTAGYGPNAQDVPAEIKALLMSHVAKVYEQRGTSIVLHLPEAEYESFKLMRL
jgi:uncharacterized phiE125 gp8 family phage protein